MGERLGVDQVADRVDLRVRGPLVLVDLDLAVVLQLDPGLGQAQALDVGRAAAGDAEVVDLGRLAAVGELDRVLARLDVLDRRPGGDRDVLLLEGSLDHPDHVLVLGREDLVEHLDQQHLGAEAAVGGGDLTARGAGADHGDLLRLLGQRPGAPGVEDAAAELDPGDRQRHRAGREDDRAGLVDVVADLDLALRGQRAVAVDQLDLVLVPEHLHAAGERVRDGGAALAERVPVDRDVLDHEPQLGAVSRLVVELGGVQDGLGRDAGVVEAAPARLVALDDGGLAPQLGGADRRDVAARAPADDDHVVGISHDAEPIERRSAVPLPRYLGLRNSGAVVSPGGPGSASGSAPSP